MKPLDEIECPKCGTPIPVSEALRHQLTQHIREELEEKVGRREKDLAVKEEALNDKAKKLGEEEKEIEKRVGDEVASAVATRETELHRRGDGCGVIVWESKHTKVWSDSWFQKLKDDLRLVKSDVAVLVSEALPKGVENFALVRGIWVTSPSCTAGLAVALRAQVIEVATNGLAGDRQSPS